MSESDPNTEAARIVRKATDEGNELPADLEEAWAAWIKGIQGIDERMRTLLRAAFEAGAEAAAAAWARRGGQKGGAARAEKLSPEERSAIAKKAAQARWGDSDYSSGSSG